MEEYIFIDGEKHEITKKEYRPNLDNNTMLIDIFYLSPVYADNGVKIKNYEEKNVQYECGNCYA